MHQISELEKLLRTIKFLEKVKDSALEQKDLACPKDRSDLFSALMWSQGMLYALNYFGYEIKKKEENK